MSHQCMKKLYILLSIETYSAGAGRDDASMVERAPEVHCYSTPIKLYNLGKCRLTDEFFRAFVTLIL